MRERDRERERERERDRDRETDRERPCVHPTSTLLNTYPFEHYSGGSLGAVACVEALTRIPRIVHDEVARPVHDQATAPVQSPVFRL